jgi:hypothetical protein
MFTNLDPILNLKLSLLYYWTCFVMIEVWNISHVNWLCPFHPQRILIDNLIPQVWNISCDWLCAFHPQRILIDNLIPQVWNISCDWLHPFHPQRILIDNLTPCGSGYPSHAPNWLPPPCINQMLFARMVFSFKFPPSKQIFCFLAIF